MATLSTVGTENQEADAEVWSIIPSQQNPILSVTSGRSGHSVLNLRLLSIIRHASMTCLKGQRRYSSSLSYRRADLWAGLATLAACTRLRDGRFSVLDAAAAVLMGGAVWAEKMADSKAVRYWLIHQSTQIQFNLKKKKHFIDRHTLRIFCASTRWWF